MSWCSHRIYSWKITLQGFFGGKTVTTVAISDCQTYHHGAEDKLMLSRDQLCKLFAILVLFMVM